MAALTCWNESSKSVCLDTLTFTWLGRALDWREKTPIQERPGEGGWPIHSSFI